MTGNSFIAQYQARVSATQAEQPHWITSLVTVPPRLEREIRTDFVRQTSIKLQNTWNFGKQQDHPGAPHRTFLQSSAVHRPPGPGGNDGFGDVSFNSKYRFYARNEEKGNATGFLARTYPTGNNGNGSCSLFVSQRKIHHLLPPTWPSLQHKTIMVCNEHTKPNEMYSSAVLFDSLKRVNTTSGEDVKARCS